MFDTKMQIPSMYPAMMMNQMGMQMQEQQLKDIHVPGVNDVMCGRGGGTNNHIGNIRFRQLVNGHKLRYLAATKSEKPMVSREVVTIWRGLNPPGRFLMQEKKSSDAGSAKVGQWYDIGDKKAREKASQCLRERTPEVLPFVKKLELQLKLQQQEESGVHDDSNDMHSAMTAQTASELSKELLHEQQQAAITAHMALKAYIPSSIMKLSQDVNANMNMNSPPPMPANPNAHMGRPMPNMTNMAMQNQPVRPAMQQQQQQQQLHIQSSHNPMMNTNQQQLFTVAYKKEQLAKEIEMLKQEQAKLEAEALAADRQVAAASAITTGQMTAEDILNELDVGSVEQGLEPIHPSESFANAQMTKEEYRNSVRALLGPSSGHSSSGGVSMTDGNTTNTFEDTNTTSKVSGGEKKERIHSFDKSDFMETMSRGSWVRSVNTFDDVSMASPGSSMKMLNDLEPLDIRDGGFLNENGILKTSDKSLGKASLSTYESQILENLMSPVNPNPDLDRVPGLPYIKENSTSGHMLPPPSQPRPTINQQNQQGQNMHNPANHLTNHQISEFSNRSMTMNARQRIETIAKMKSDPSMFNDNMSDLSEAMGSLDVSTNKSYKE
jgi:hypothetical protein